MLIKIIKTVVNKPVLASVLLLGTVLTTSVLAKNLVHPEEPVQQPLNINENEEASEAKSAGVPDRLPETSGDAEPSSTRDTPSSRSDTSSGSVASSSAPADPVSPQVPRDTFQINEQFSGNTLNNDLWEIITYPKGYRNNEEQDYRPSQVAVRDGTLQLTATRDAGGEWHSGEVHSRWNYLYGEFEVRMALSATGPGVWPAAWLMGVTDHWPNGGEIDIVENINGSSSVHGTLHGGGASGHWQLQKTFSPINITQYHTYKIIKQPGVITWWIDGSKRGGWRQSDTPPGGIWPFENHRSFGLLNLAIGGTWPGPSSASTPNTITMYVDYFTVKNGI